MWDTVLRLSPEHRLIPAALTLALVACQHTPSSTPASGAAAAAASATAPASAEGASTEAEAKAASAAGSQPAAMAAATEASSSMTLVNGQRPVIAVAGFYDQDDEIGWLGFLVADHISRRLLVGQEPGAAEYPVDVFNWRQTMSAARYAGLSPVEARSARLALLREMGADHLVIGRYAIEGPKVTIRWQLVSRSETKDQKVTVRMAEISKAASGIGAAILEDLGRADDSEEPLALPRGAARSWGIAQSVLSRQSQDARATVVLKPTERAKARAELKTVTRQAPIFGPAWAALAVVNALDGKWDEADEALKRADALVEVGAPDAALAHYYVYEKTARQADGRAALAQAVETHPGALQVLGYLGDAYYAAGDYEKAFDVFTKYLERVPTSPYAARRRDAVLARLGRKEEALENAQALMAKHPDSITILTAFASRQIDAGYLDEARQTLLKGLKIKPDDPLLLTRLSFVELEGGDPKKALALAKKAVALVGDGRGKPVAGYAYIDLARALAVAGRQKEAKTNLIKAVKLGVDAGDLKRLEDDPRLNGFIEFPIVVQSD